jgi:hypothetical protein
MRSVLDRSVLTEEDDESDYHRTKSNAEEEGEDSDGQEYILSPVINRRKATTRLRHATRKSDKTELTRSHVLEGRTKAKNQYVNKVAERKLDYDEWEDSIDVEVLDIGNSVVNKYHGSSASESSVELDQEDEEVSASSHEISSNISSTDIKRQLGIVSPSNAGRLVPKLSKYLSDIDEEVAIEDLEEAFQHACSASNDLLAEKMYLSPFLYYLFNLF